MKTSQRTSFVAFALLLAGSLANSPRALADSWDELPEDLSGQPLEPDFFAEEGIAREDLAPCEENDDICLEAEELESKLDTLPEGEADSFLWDIEQIPNVAPMGPTDEEDEATSPDGDEGYESENYLWDIEQIPNEDSP